MAIMDLNVVRVKLRDWFATKMPEACDVEISSLRRPGAGNSNETFFVELQWRQGSETKEEKLVVRWPPGEGYKVFPDHAYDMVQQYKVLKLLGNTCVPVPPTRWLEEDTSVIGVPFYIVDQVEGWVPSDFPSYHLSGRLFDATAEEKAKTWWGAVDTIAAIHTLDWEKAGLGFLGVPTGKGFMERQIAKYEEVFWLNDEPMPDILKTTRDWLWENSFEPRRLSLCWGDARLGNMMIRDQKVAAVLDWEMASIGDAESDLGWFVHMDWALSVGRPDNPFPRMANLPDMRETLAHYEQVTQRKVENLHYYEVLATWRQAILFTRMENSERYLALSKNKKGFVNWAHFEKLKNMLSL